MLYKMKVSDLKKNYAEVFSTLYKLNFADLKKNHVEVLDYCLKNSDYFSVMTYLKKPYSRGKIIDEHAEKLVQWDSYLIKRKVGINEWPGTLSGSYGHALYVYNSQEIRKNILDLPNLFQPIENGWPEDICFYRNDEEWLVTTSHEEEAYLRFATEADLAFFKERGML